MKTHISFYYGPSAWDEIVKIEGDMRKKRKEAVYAAEERRQKIMEIIFAGVTVVVGALVLGLIVYIIGLSNGSW